MILRNSFLFPGETEIMCKYFLGLKDSRYGDLQSVHPADIWKPVQGKYQTFALNGFVNIVLDDSFLYEYIVSYVQSIPFNNYAVQEPSELGIEYIRYVFSVYIKELWQFNFAKFDISIMPENHKRLAVMAFFLIELIKEKDPPYRESFLKLYDTFSSELYCVLSSGVITEAAPLLKLLAACAVNIPVCQEA